MLNLKAEMARKNISVEEIASTLKLHRNTVSLKINGKTQFTIEETFLIKEKFFPDCDLKFLFEREVG